MPGGRPPKPTALKVLQGNPGKRPLPKGEPQPPAPEGDAAPPAWLAAGPGREMWRRLVGLLGDLRVLTEADREALALGCDAYGEYVKLRRYLKRHGVTYQSITQSGGFMIRPRPEVAMAQDAWRRTAAMLQQFGLTPSSRAKVQALPDGEEDPFERWLSGSQRTS